MRKRDYTKWGDPTEWNSEQDFLNSDIGSGLHSIAADGHLFDVYVQNRSSPVTFVTFHAAIPRGIAAPVFAGDDFTKKNKANLISFSDPSVTFSEHVNLGWFLGTRDTGPLVPRLTPLIKHLLTQMETKRTVLWGASGGGFAALRFSPEFPDAIVLTVNPRVRFNDNEDAVRQYVQHAWEPADDEETERIVAKAMSLDLLDLYPDRLPVTLLMFQNTGDERYYPGQHIPFVERNAPDPRLFERLEHVGKGHLRIPPATHYEILDAVSDTSLSHEEVAKAAGFSPAQ